MLDGLKVMFVEDEAAVRFAGVQALRLAGLEVEPYPSAEALIAQVKPSFPGIVVSDIRLPGLSGIELLDRLQKIDSALPVILITGHGDISMAVNAMRAGAYDFIEKPVASDYLVSAVRRALEKRALTLELQSLRMKLGGGGIETILIGQSEPMRALRHAIMTLGDAAPDVLIHGETGTGKELVAQCLHRFSRLHAGRLVAINCGAVPEPVFESEMFGYEPGAFTGAQKRRIGKIEYASGGALFLDEIESMPLGLQVKMLRVLQDRALERLGSNQTVKVNVRLIAATKADLSALSEAQTFRGDLYYRLNVVTLHVPPLRERREDIPVLFAHFAAEAGERYDRTPAPPPERLLAALMTHAWPGNVRELRNAADRFVLGVLDETLRFDRQDTSKKSLPAIVEDFERGLILEALRASKGDVAKASEAIGIPKKTLYDKMRRFGLGGGQR